MDDTQILISLYDDRAKYIAEVISNKSCKKILSYLGQHEDTVSDVARELKMPLNTVDYNIKKLIKAGLIEKASHWWSVKGKKMPTYKVSNKKIVISPRSVKGYSKYLFALVASGVVALGLKGLEVGKASVNLGKTSMESAVSYANETREALRDGVEGYTASLTETSASAAVKKTSEAVGQGVTEVVTKGGDVVSQGATEIVARSGDIMISGYLGMDVWLWFLFGAWFVIFIFFIFHIFRERGFRNA